MSTTLIYKYVQDTHTLERVLEILKPTILAFKIEIRAIMMLA
jgi:hypothetical protein